MTMNWDNAMWLAARQMRDNWLSYLYSAAYFGFMGAVLANDESWTVEFAMIVLMFILVQPSLSPRYMTLKEDNEVSRHQMFLHTLPISVSTIVGARLIAVLAAGAINAPLFFLPFWYLGPDWASFGSYLGWCAFWFGLALVGTGLALMQEFWLSMRTWTKVNASAVISVIVGLFLMLWLGDFRPYARSVEYANENPWVMAVIGLVVGMVVLWRGTVSAVKGFRRREFAT